MKFKIQKLRATAEQIPQSGPPVLRRSYFSRIVANFYQSYTISFLFKKVGHASFKNIELITLLIN
jgi:hypothetical protein